MTDTPDFQIPDAVSEADLRAALAKGMPHAARLPALRFGRSDAGEGLHDLVIAHCLLIKQSEGEGPSIPQLITATTYLAETLSKILNSRYDAQAAALEAMVNDPDPATATAARGMRQSIASEAERGRLLLAQLLNAAESIRAEVVQALGLMEAMGIVGRPGEQRPSKRQRLVSDALLDSAGVDRAKFDAYFNSKAPD